MDRASHVNESLSRSLLRKIGKLSFLFTPIHTISNTPSSLWRPARLPSMSALASYHNATSPASSSSASVITAGGTPLIHIGTASVLVLFGSQTGNAEGIAQILHSSMTLMPWGKNARLFQMNQYITKNSTVIHCSLPPFTVGE